MKIYVEYEDGDRRGVGNLLTKETRIGHMLPDGKIEIPEHPEKLLPRFVAFDQSRQAFLFSADLKGPWYLFDGSRVCYFLVDAR